jgi:hypothetical protein
MKKKFWSGASPTSFSLVVGAKNELPSFKELK